MTVKVKMNDVPGDTMEVAEARKRVFFTCQARKEEKPILIM